MAACKWFIVNTDSQRTGPSCSTAYWLADSWNDVWLNRSAAQYCINYFYKYYLTEVFGNDGYAFQIHVFREFAVVFDGEYCTFLWVDTEVMLIWNFLFWFKIYFLFNFQNISFWFPRYLSSKFLLHFFSVYYLVINFFSHLIPFLNFKFYFIWNFSQLIVRTWVSYNIYYRQTKNLQRNRVVKHYSCYVI
jgi:hypothetical protein